MTLKFSSMIAAIAVAAALLAGVSIAAEPIDQMTPVDDATLDGVQGPTGISKKDAAVPDADGNLSQAKTSFDGMDAVASANTNNTLGVGIISLNNAADGSALSLSNSLANSAGAASGGGVGIGQ